MCCGTEAGSYLRLIDSCITRLKAQGPSRTCNESEEEEKKRRTNPGTLGHLLSAHSASLTRIYTDRDAELGAATGILVGYHPKSGFVGI